MGVISDGGEFLLTVEGEGTFGKPWFHVRTQGSPTIRDLGPYPANRGSSHPAWTVLQRSA